MDAQIASYVLAVILLGIIMAGHLVGRRIARAFPQGMRSHSTPHYHGMFIAIAVGVPASVLIAIWDLLSDHVFAQGQHSTWQEGAFWAKVVVMASVAILALTIARSRLNPEFRARRHCEKFISVMMLLCALVAILTTVGIAITLLFEALRFFNYVSPVEFITGTEWSSEIAIRPDQAGGSGKFGAVPVFLGTLVIAAVAMVVATPVGIWSAIYLNQYASEGMRDTAKFIMELLAGVPTVVYGFFAARTVAPAVQNVSQLLGVVAQPDNALAAGLVMGAMLIPFICSTTEDALHRVPKEMLDGATALGATTPEAVWDVQVPAALPGIAGGILLAVSRAVGETMIVVMAAGLMANMTINPLEAVTTVTAQIVSLLTGDQSFDDVRTLSAFGLALTLGVSTLILNLIATLIVRKYQERY